MASDGNAEVVRVGYKAFNAGDMETLMKLFDEGASWHTPGKSSIAGDRQGREATFAQFGRYGGGTGGTFKANLLHVLQDDDGRVVGVHRNTAVRNGKHLGSLFQVVPGEWLDQVLDRALSPNRKELIAHRSPTPREPREPREPRTSEPRT